MSIKGIVELANECVAEGYSVSLHKTWDNNLVLKVFHGNQWTGGRWKKMAETRDDTFFGTIQDRKYICKRNFFLTDDGNIALTPCMGECIAEIRHGEFVDYTTICELRG